VSLRLVFPGLGVECRSEGSVQSGSVKLVRAERIPSRCGVVLEAQVEGLAAGGSVLINPLERSSGVCMSELCIEPMVVEPDQSGKVSIVVSNPSFDVMYLDKGQTLGSAYQCDEPGTKPLKFASEWAEVCSVCKVEDESVVRREKLDALLGAEWGSGAVRELVLDSHDVFAVMDGERGEVKEVCHEVETGDSPPISQAARRVPFALREGMSRLVDEMLSGGVIRVPGLALWFW